jgi:hypothetical protein
MRTDTRRAVVRACLSALLLASVAVYAASPHARDDMNPAPAARTASEVSRPDSTAAFVSSIGQRWRVGTTDGRRARLFELVAVVLLLLLVEGALRHWNVRARGPVLRSFVPRPAAPARAPPAATF